MSFNSGGPSSRTRSEAVIATLLGKNDGPIRIPEVLALALDFERRDPVNTMTRLLRSRGLQTPDDLRKEIEPLPEPSLCHVDRSITPLNVRTSDPGRVLRVAVLLGLCTAVFFDPTRPVIWTEASLKRRVRLFDTKGFYAS